MLRAATASGQHFLFRFVTSPGSQAGDNQSVGDNIELGMAPANPFNFSPRLDKQSHRVVKIASGKGRDARANRFNHLSRRLAALGHQLTHFLKVRRQFILISGRRQRERGVQIDEGLSGVREMGQSIIRGFPGIAIRRGMTKYHAAPQERGAIDQREHRHGMRRRRSNGFVVDRGRSIGIAALQLKQGVMPG